MAGIRLRPSADYRAPGIYQEYDAPEHPQLEIANTRIAAFVGLTQKGPMNEPTRIANWDEFAEIFGPTSDSYTADAVYGFFRNGGTDCWIVRVAHCAPKGETAGLEHAACADQTINDAWNKPTLKIRALNEGSWGNSIWFRCVHAPGVQALLTRDLDIGSGEAHISSTRGFEVGALVRIYDRENSDYVVITEVGDKVVKWGVETPVNRRHRAAAPTHLEVMTFEIHVALRDRREVFKGLQMHPSSRNYAPRVLEQRSRLVRLENLATKSPVPHNLPAQLPLTRLAGGRDGADAITPEDFLGIDIGPGERSGLLSLGANEEIGLLAIPDAMRFYDREPGPAGELKVQHIQDQMIAMCENLKDRFAILDIPQSKDIDWVVRWRRRVDTSYAAFYWPWLRTTNANEEPRVLPPSGHLAGCYARRDQEEGVHHVAANIEIAGAQDIALRLTEDHLGLLNNEQVNTFRLQRGVRPWGGRTASSDPQWRYIPVRRLFIMLRRSLEAGFAWVPFEPNDKGTWDSIQRQVSRFLTDLHAHGMLAGGNVGDAFFVKCDAETNSPDQIAAGQLVCDIGVAPVVPAEFIMISLVETMQSPTT